MDEELEVGGGEAVALLRRRRRIADVACVADATRNERAALACDAAELDHHVGPQVRRNAPAVREAVYGQPGRRVDPRRAVRALRLVPLHTTTARPLANYVEYMTPSWLAAWRSG